MEEENNISLLDFIEKSGKEKIDTRQRTKVSDGEIDIDTKFGESTYDEKFFPDAQLNKDGTGLNLFEFIDENRAQRQPNLAKAAALVGRAGAKALTEIAKTPGVIGGIVAAPFAEEGEGWETAFNNGWIKAINDISEDVNTEVLPVYVKKAIKEGSLVDNIFSIDFWATEGADGVGYMAAMFAPGALLNKFKLGEKMFRGAGKLTNMMGKSDEAGNVLSSIGITPKNLDMANITLANTLFEAAAEAQGAGDKYMADIEKELADGTISQEKAKMRKAEVMRNTFVANAAILMGPNVIMSKMLWGKGARKVEGALVDDAGDVLSEVAKGSFGSKLAHLGKDIAKGSATEGFFEEGMQSTVENYFTEKAKNRQSPSLIDTLGDLPKAYLENFATTEGQKAIFLGSVLGGGMTAYQGKKERNAGRKETNKLLGELHKVDSFFKIFSGDTYNEDYTINEIELREKLKAFDNSEKLGELFDMAIERGDAKTIGALRAFTAGELMKPYIFNSGLGINGFTKYLETSKTIKEIAEKEQTDVKNIIEPILERAEKLQKNYNTFKEFGASFVDLEGGAKDIKMQYYDQLASEYISRKNMQYAYNSELEILKDKKSTLLESLDIKNPIEDDVEFMQARNNNFALQEVEEDIKDYEKLIANLKKEDNNFWKKETHQEDYNKRVKLVDDFKKAQEKEEEIAKAAAEVQNATTEEEVDNVSKTGTIADTALNETKKSKKNELKAEKAAQKDAQIQTQKDKSDELKENKVASLNERNSFIENVATNYNIGETIEVPESINKELGGATAEIVDITDENIVLSVVSEAGITEVVFNRAGTINTPSDVESDFVTEGSANHESLTPKNTRQKIDRTEPKTGSKVISTDEYGKPLSFISKAYIEYEKTPIDKTNKSIKFKVNSQKFSNEKWNNAIKGYDKLVKGETLTQKEKDFLIDHLPINAVFADGVEAPIETLPSTADSQTIFNNSSKILRTNIVNALLSGAKLEDITTIVEGQYGGVLKVQDNVPESSILDLYHFKGMSKKEKIDYLLANLGYIRDNGDIQMLNGDINYFSKEDKPSKANAKGELYLMIPKANGKPFPLKLNIKRISEPYSELLYNINKYRLDNKDQSDLTTLSEIKDKELVKGIKENFKEEIKLIGKNVNDITIKDIVDFFVWETTSNSKSKLSFIDKDKSMFVYGDKKKSGGQAVTSDQLNKEDFKSWLQNNKRQAINIKPRKDQTTKANIKDNIQYLEYIIDNNILNTNAVVNEPTFGGYTNIYLNSHKVSYPKAAPKKATTNDIKPYDIKKDGDSLFSATINNKEYYASLKTGRVFGSKGVNTDKAIPSDNPFVGTLITDNSIIEQVEYQSKQDPLLGSPDTKLLRYGQPEVSKTLETTPNTPENKIIEKKKEEVKKKDIIVNIDIQNKIKEVINNKTFIVLSEDGSGYINKKTGKKYQRVTQFIQDKEVKPSPLLESSQIIGTKVDILIRDFFANELKDLSTYDVSSLSEVKGLVSKLEDIKKYMDSRGEIVLANDIILYNDELGIAGTVDLLTYDKNGNVRIYDTKTMRGNNFNTSYGNESINKYESTQYGKSKKEKHSEQLSLYRILLNNTHGIKAKTLGILPIEISYNAGDVSTSKLNLLTGIKVPVKDKVLTASIKDNKIDNNITKEQINQVFKRLLDNKIIKISAQSKALLSGTNQENFNKLKEIADKNSIAIDDIITKCK